MLLCKFSRSYHDLYLAFIQWMVPGHLILQKIISKLGSAFSDKSSLFNGLYKCFNIAMRDDEDVRHYVGIGNRLFNCSQFGTFREEQIRYFIFVTGLRFPCSAEIRLRLPSLLDREPNIKVHDLVDEYSKFRNLFVESICFWWCCATLNIYAIQGYIPGEDDFHGVPRHRSKYQPHGPRLDRWLNFIQFPDENEIYQTPTLELTNEANLVRGGNQCLLVAEFLHPTIPTQFSKPDSHRTLL